MKKYGVVVANLVVLLVLVCSANAFGQLTIINTPSTDTLQEKMFYVELNALGKPTSFSRGGFQSYGYRTVYGVNKKTEVGVSFFYTRNGVNSPKELQFTGKRSLFIKEKWGMAGAAGISAFVPLNRSAGNRTVLMAYSNVSKSFSKLKGLRLTGGAYRIINGGRDFGKKYGALAGFELPVFKRVSFIGDYQSGKNRFGYAALGLNVAVTKRQFLLGTYNVANLGGEGNYAGLVYGITF